MITLLLLAWRIWLVFSLSSSKSKPRTFRLKARILKIIKIIINKYVYLVAIHFVGGSDMAPHTLPCCIGQWWLWVGRSRCRRATCARPCVHILRVLITGDQTNLETSETAMTSCSSFLSFSLDQTQPPFLALFYFPFLKNILRLNMSTLFIRRTASSACC